MIRVTRQVCEVIIVSARKLGKRGREVALHILVREAAMLERDFCGRKNPARGDVNSKVRDW
jgi:hypothetical protein